MSREPQATHQRLLPPSIVAQTRAGDNFARSIRGQRKLSERVTVQPLTKKRKISLRPLKIEYQLLPPIPWPLSPARRGGKGNFFCGALQAGYARLQSPNFFLPLPNGADAVGEGAGGGAKATGHKGPFIAVWLPGARLNSHSESYWTLIFAYSRLFFIFYARISVHPRPTLRAPGPGAGRSA